MLVPNRECGECVECCRFTSIKEEELQKPTNLLCPHCVEGEGCQIYNKRPSPCSSWYCGWRFIENLSDDWRPDKSGVAIWEPRNGDASITLVILDKTKMVRTTEFTSIVAGWIAKGIPVFISRCGDIGFKRGLVLINNLLVPSMEAGDLEAAERVIADVILYIDHRHEWEPDGIELSSTLGD